MTVMPIHESASSEETLPSTAAFSSVGDVAPSVVPSSPEEIDAISSVAPSSIEDVAPTMVPSSIGEIAAPSTVAFSSVKDIVPTVVPSSTEEITTTYSSTVTSTYLSTDIVTVTSHSSAVPVSSVAPIASAPAPAPPANVPTPVVTVIATPGVYTIPATTITLTKTEAVCVPETTSLAPGTQTYGGVTTIVATSTTVVCPLATVTVEDGVTTSKIYTTTYICPSAGTYIIGATTSTVTGTVTVPCEYPVPTVYLPGTYTQPEVVTTITVTSQVVTCPLFTAGPTAGPSTTAAPVVATSAPVAAPAPISSAAPAPISSAAPVSSVVATVIPSASSAAPAPPVQSSPASSAGSGPWAITYSPYANDGGCKSASAIDTDIADIASKGFQNVRLYATDCSGLENVGGSAEKHGLGLIMGVFIKAGGVHTADSQVQDLITWNKWNLIVLFVVGNESIFNGYCSAAELAAYIASVTSQVRAAGYKGSVTTTEPLNIIQASAGALCSVVDVVGVNIHPYFNSGVTADKAGEFLAGQLQLAEGKLTLHRSLN